MVMFTWKDASDSWETWEEKTSSEGQLRESQCEFVVLWGWVVVLHARTWKEGRVWNLSMICLN